MTVGYRAVLIARGRRAPAPSPRHMGLASAAALTVTLAAMLAVANTRPDVATAASGPVGFHEVAQGSRGFELPGEPERARGRVVRSRSQATALLGTWGVDNTVTKSVNFARESLIVVLAPWQPTGGYRAAVSRVVVRGSLATVTAGVRSEGAETVGSSTTRPWVIVAVKRTVLARVRGEVRLQLR